MATNDAVRFLKMATFGPDSSSLAEVQARDIDGWIKWQYETVTPTLQAPILIAASATQHSQRQAAWWETVLTGEDQLRQRVAWALSQIFALGDYQANLSNIPIDCAVYYDIFIRNAFGSFRDIVEEVSKSPVMGRYLSHLRNDKASGAIKPDENYAREVMQLFTIGLWYLNDDGTRMLDSARQPIPTYNNDDITNAAKVFTGWNFANATNWSTYTSNYSPMEPDEAHHDQTAKSFFVGTDEELIISDSPTPTCQSDMTAFLDALCDHPSHAPFICRQLIQRLTQSDPSPSYVSDIVEIYRSTDGNLFSTVSSILMHNQALTPGAGKGKVQEPIILATQIMRMIGYTQTSNFTIANPQNHFKQGALRSPSVFNFYRPDYQPAPELQIFDQSAVIANHNWWHYFLFESPDGFSVNLQLLTMLVASPQATLVFIRDVLLHGSMSQGFQDRILAAHASISSAPGMTGEQLAKHILWLVATSPEFTVIV